MLESLGKEGVYYVLKFPTAWRLYAFPAEEFHDIWHGPAWKRYVVPDLASAWHENLGLDEKKLAAALEPWHKGFPRGRIERTSPKEFTLLHGDDLQETGISIDRVIRAFDLGLLDKVTMTKDPHECQDPRHATEVKAILRLK